MRTHARRSRTRAGSLCCSCKGGTAVCAAASYGGTAMQHQRGRRQHPACSSASRVSSPVPHRLISSAAPLCAVYIPSLPSSPYTHTHTHTYPSTSFSLSPYTLSLSLSLCVCVCIPLARFLHRLIHTHIHTHTHTHTHTVSLYLTSFIALYSVCVCVCAGSRRTTACTG